jgi:hypothetical protein
VLFGLPDRRRRRADPAATESAASGHLIELLGIELAALRLLRLAIACNISRLTIV